MKVNTSASGLYHCEVSAEAPNFETADKEANFTVIGKSQLLKNCAPSFFLNISSLTSRK